MLKCPDLNENYNLRLNEWKEIVDRYISSKALHNLFDMFGHKVKMGSLEERLRDMSEFANLNWDFLKKEKELSKIACRAERYHVVDRDDVVIKNSSDILDSARELGMIGARKEHTDADYIVVLGGARMANFERMREAKRLRNASQNQARIIVLGAERYIGEKEYTDVLDTLLFCRRKRNEENTVVTSGKKKKVKTDTEVYAESFIRKLVEGVNTEYDEIILAMEQLISDQVTNEVSGYKDNNQDMRWIIREYDRDAVCCANKLNGKERANTLDTYDFLIEHFGLKEGSKIHFVTSSIYINYQFPLFMKKALENGLMYDFSGYETEDDHASVVSNYLQEIKGSLDVLYKALFTTN